MTSEPNDPSGQVMELPPIMDYKYDKMDTDLKEMEIPAASMTTSGEESAILSTQDEVSRCSAQCPMHCSSKTANRLAPTGLYGQIADLKSQIHQLLKKHSQEKDALVSQVSELENQHTNMKSEKRWLESKVKYLTHIIGTHGSKSGSFAKNAGHPYTSMMNLAVGTSVMTPIQEADEDSYWAGEKEKLVKSNKQLVAQIRKLDEQRIRLNAELHEAREQLELLEFRMLELEEDGARGGTSGDKDTKQFHDECVGTDELLSSSNSPLLEIVFEIPKKLCDIAKQDEIGWQDNKLSLLQSFAVLGLYQKLVREQANKESRPSNVMNEVNEVKMAPDRQPEVRREENHDSNAKQIETDQRSSEPTGNQPDGDAGQTDETGEKPKFCRDEDVANGSRKNCDDSGSEPVLRLNEASAPLLVELDTLEKQAKRFLDSSPHHKRGLPCCDASTNTDLGLSEAIKMAAEELVATRTYDQSWARESTRSDRAAAAESGFPEGLAKADVFASPKTGERAEGDDGPLQREAWRNRPIPKSQESAVPEAVENARNLLALKTQELLNKEAEYCMRLEALKCEKDECVYRLERRIDAIQERELKRRKEGEALIAEKLADCEGRLQQLAAAFEAERDDWSRRLEESRQAVEQLDRMCRQLQEEERQREVAYEGEGMYGAGEELRERLDEMKKLERKQKMSIAELEKCLGALKAEVELSTMAWPDTTPGESEEDVLVKKVKELVEAQSRFHLRIGQLEKKEAAYRQTLDEADRIVADVERNYQERLEEMSRSEAQMRSKIKRLEQNERWMNQALKASAASAAVPQCGEVNKVTELLEQLMEAESAETQLKEKLYESQVRESEARRKLNEAERSRQEAEDQQGVLSERVRQLEASESALRETLRNADDILATREKSLLESIERLKEELKLQRQSGAAHGHEGGSGMGSCFSRREVEEMTSELQKLNGCETGLELVKQRLKEVLSYVLVCPSCHPHCGQALRQLESQVQQLHEIVFGSCATSTSHAGRLLHSPDGSRTGTPLDNNNASALILASSHAGMLDKGTREANGQLEVNMYSEDSNGCIIDRVSTTIHHHDRHLGSDDRVSDHDLLRRKRNLKDLEDQCREKNAEISSLSLNVAQLQDENENLKRVLWNTEKCQTAAMDKAAQRAEEIGMLRKRMVDLEAKVGSLVRQLRSFEQVQKDKENLQEAMEKCKMELKEKREIEHRLHAENLHLHHKMEALRERVNSLQLLKKENKALTMKQGVLEKRLSSASLSMTPLRQQITALSKECWQKDRAIEELSRELSRALQHVDDHQILLHDYRAVKLQSISQSSDDSGITRDHSPTSMTSREDEASDDCALTDLSSISTVDVHYPTFSVSQSVEENPSQTSAGEACKKSMSRIPRYTALAKPSNGLPPRCQNGQQKSCGALPSSKSAASVCNGQQSTRKLASGPRRARCCSTSSSDGSTCSDTVMQSTSTVRRQRLQKLPPPSGKPKLATKFGVKPVNPMQNVSEAVVVTRIAPYNVQPNPRLSTIPDAPGNFRVTRKVGQDGLLVAWDVPAMDSSGCSNGSTVSGYQIFVNGCLHQNVRSAHRTKALLNNLDLAERVLPVDISIKTLSLTGQESLTVATKFTGDGSLEHLTRKTNAQCAFEQLRQKFNGSFPERGRIADYIAEQAERTTKLNSSAKISKV